MFSVLRQKSRKSTHSTHIPHIFYRHPISPSPSFYFNNNKYYKYNIYYYWEEERASEGVYVENVEYVYYVYQVYFSEKCLEVSRNLRTFAFDGSNDRAPAFFEADTHYHLHARMQSTLHLSNRRTCASLGLTRTFDCVRGAKHVVIRWF